MKFFRYITLILVLISCGNDDGPPSPPEGALLVFPLEDSECTTGVSINEELSQVTFEWMPAKNSDLYTLTVLNLNTNIPQAIASASTSVALSIEKGAPFSWSVISSNTDSDITATSDNWLFYNAGSQTSYPPFPAQLIAPKSGSTIQMNSANEISLEWFGADVEDDIEQFQVYFSDQNPPALFINTNKEVLETNVNVISGTTYYWKVVTTDSDGNTSDSGVFDFKVL